MPDDKLARALGSKIRRDMLHILLHQELSVHELAEKLCLTEVTASKHLKKLYDLGILKTYTKGRERFYKNKISNMKQLIIWYDKVAEKIPR